MVPARIGGVNSKKFYLLLFALGMVFLLQKTPAQGTTFFYQGHLNDSGNPANGHYDFVFSLYDAPTNGNLVAVPQTNLNVTVANGLFTENLDFGAVFTGPNYWLDIGVRPSNPNPTNTFTSLSPRQPLLPTPYAIFANSSSNLLGTLPAAQLAGTLTATQLSGTYSGVISFTNAGNNFSGAFAGDGGALNGLNGSQIAFGTVADARLSTNVALRDAGQTFTGDNQFTGANRFTNWNNSFTGSFFGNGLVGWIPVAGTTQQAARDTGYMLLSSGMTTVTLPPTAVVTNGDIVRISGAGSGGWLVKENSGQTIVGNFPSYQNAVILPTAVGADWHGMAASANGAIMYACSSDGISISMDSGTSWHSTGTSGSYYSIACSADGTKIFAISQNNASINYSPDGGSTWSAVPGSIAPWGAITCLPDGSKFYVGVKGGQVYQGTPSGLAVVNGSPVANWSALAVSADGSRLVGANGAISFLAGGGGSSPGNCTWLTMSADGLKLVAAGSGNIYTSTNSGASWTTTPAPSGGWSCLGSSSDCDRIIAGINGGLLYASANFGLSWNAITHANQNWSGIAVSADGTKFAAAVSSDSSVSGSINYATTAAQFLLSTNSTISGSQGAAIELQYIGNGRFMPVSQVGTIWAN